MTYGRRGERWRRRYRIGFCLWASVFLSVLVSPPVGDARRALHEGGGGEVIQTQASKTEKPAPYQAALLMEAETGKVLFEKDAHVPWPPASMVKMMTTMVVLDRVRAGALTLDETVTASRWAAQMGGSQIYLKEGERFTVEELLKAVMIHSANDAAVALAEHVAGSTDAFVDLMNEKAEQLGLRETRFHSVHGLPADPGQEEDLMSAYDLALLGRALMKYPEAAKWAAVAQEPFRDGQFTLTNPNHLLRQFPGADGVKTGYHKKAGFCVTGSAKRGDLQLIVVVLGSARKHECFRSAAQLLNQGFANYRMLVPVKAGVALGREAPVRGGVVDHVPLVAAQDVRVLVKKGEEKKVQVEIHVPDRVSAPITTGQVLGEIVVKLDGAEVGKTPATAAQDVAQASLWKRWWPF
ncbi:MAG: D-alanyl-D-alanine carboxypeptidase [Candidatus Binatia bacterium]|nr:D-alanyl-D-alanine carboxypeptidase [Candidatus Binatia bacterium]